MAACERFVEQYDERLIYVYLCAVFARKGETWKAPTTVAELLKRGPNPFWYSGVGISVYQAAQLSHP